MSRSRNASSRLALLARLLGACALLAAAFAAQAAPAGAEIVIHNAAELSAALRSLKGGATLKIAPGVYPANNYVTGVERLTVEALAPKNPPLFKGGVEGWHFSRCPGLTLRNLCVSGQSGNGLNLDEGGPAEKPATSITLERIEVSDIGPSGNHDGIKCSGLDGLTIRDCTITGWGGQGIDWVGCHHSLITGCRITGKPGFTGDSGIQLKGGSSDSVVEHCRLVNAGGRPIQVGGSTGAPFFRPLGANFEARRITVRDCVIEGGQCATAFTSVDGAEFTGNTILFPEKWAFRILGTPDAKFIPPRNVLVKGNRIVFRRAQVQIEVNIGPHTAPETFRFEGNQWFAEDAPSASKPKLPVAERDGVYGRDPRPRAS